jgi:DNA-binding XRE family transcriptional regulator
MNKNRLNAVMAVNGETQKLLAKVIGVNLPNLNAKINGHVDFRANEIKQIKDHYGLTAAEVDEIFFG